ncbi:hypothetical protein [Tenacibaculum maritimum]|uniref:hypothetical protein n=1 Tax=Tenacibaculum maritimum TaxID=107401 RepID=UPI0012E5FCD4|nr:hypothetical protein [Tenacibaculum maritimum]MCD9563375.1 hypothetical protein [Tenacibaculum maritimum]MCD9566270.1 hypothetical protein [Tenacibaculum maritimum]MCD9578702.1 hypothetical protein [Tenacibaculum maritimum]MCD9584565.1 hypothetical protein [Tenacibaculum maritimum]MCD9596804.1 hypothetical protein [Tenacibaculum maritimum]
MKKILFIALCCLSFSAFSQIELVETTKTEIVSKISYVYLEKAGDNEYNLYYKNMNALGHEYVHFGFKNLNNDYDKLYEIMMKGFEDKPRDPLQIKANGDVVWLKYSREEGNLYLQIQQFVSRDPDVMTVSRLLTKEDITNLFKK